MIAGLDHLVIPVTDVEATVRFYETALGLQAIRSAEGRVALTVGSQQTNLHPLETDISPRAVDPRPGGADFCLVAGPVARIGALGQMRSIYFRNPDGNLAEAAKYE